MKSYEVIELDEDDIRQAITEKYLVKLDDVSIYYERDYHMGRNRIKGVILC